MAQQARLDEKLSLLRRTPTVADARERGLVVGPIAKTGLLKMRIKGSVQLRPLLLAGHCEPRFEVTFVAGATERDGRLAPPGIVDLARTRAARLVRGEARRREYDAD